VILILKVCPLLKFEGCSNEINLGIVLGKEPEAVKIVLMCTEAFATILICSNAPILLHSSWLTAGVSCTLACDHLCCEQVSFEQNSCISSS
jgi:hypothetical protein